MHTLFQQFFYGEIAPHELTIRPNSAYADAAAQFSSAYERLHEHTATDRKLLLRLGDAHDLLLAVTAEEYFFAGLRLGAAFARELQDERLGDLLPPPRPPR